MELKALIGAIASIVLAISTAWCALNRDIGRIEGKIDGVDKRFELFNQNVGRLDKQLERFESQLRVLEADVVKLNAAAASLGTLGSRLAVLEDQHRAIDAGIQRLGRNLVPEGAEPIPSGFYNDVASRLRRIEDRLNDLTSRIQGAIKPSSN